MGTGQNPTENDDPTTVSRNGRENVSTERIFRSEFLKRQRAARKAKYQYEILDKLNTDYVLTGRRSGDTGTDTDASFFTFTNVISYCLCLIGTFVGASSALMGPRAYNMAMNPIVSVDGGDEIGGYILMLFLFIVCGLCTLGMSILVLVELAAREECAWESKKTIDMSLDHTPTYRFSIVLTLLMAFLAFRGSIATGNISFISVAWIGFFISLWLTHEIRARYSYAIRHNDAMKKAAKQ